MSKSCRAARPQGGDTPRAPRAAARRGCQPEPMLVPITSAAAPSTLPRFAPLPGDGASPAATSPGPSPSPGRSALPALAPASFTSRGCPVPSRRGLYRRPAPKLLLSGRRTLTAPFTRNQIGFNCVCSRFVLHSKAAEASVVRALCLSANLVLSNSVSVSP
ncbi:hypothetical protein ABZP36_017921 [Zizania latifolia]